MTQSCLSHSVGYFEHLSKIVLYNACIFRSNQCCPELAKRENLWHWTSNGANIESFDLPWCCEVVRDIHWTCYRLFFSERKCHWRNVPNHVNPISISPTPRIEKNIYLTRWSFFTWFRQSERIFGQKAAWYMDWERWTNILPTVLSRFVAVWPFLIGI